MDVFSLWNRAGFCILTVCELVSTGFLSKCNCIPWKFTQPQFAYVKPFDDSVNSPHSFELKLNSASSCAMITGSPSLTFLGSFYFTDATVSLFFYKITSALFIHSFIAHNSLRHSSRNASQIGISSTVLSQSLISMLRLWVPQGRPLLSKRFWIDTHIFSGTSNEDLTAGKLCLW